MDHLKWLHLTVTLRARLINLSYNQGLNSLKITRLNKYRLRVDRRCATENNERKVSETVLTIQKFNATEQK